MITSEYMSSTSRPRMIRVQNPFQKLVAKGGNVVINAGQIQAAAEGE